MKVLIWIVCIIVSSVIQVLIRPIIWGVIPAVILYALMSFIAFTICKKVDERNKKDIPSIEQVEKALSQRPEQKAYGRDEAKFLVKKLRRYSKVLKNQRINNGEDRYKEEVECTTRAEELEQWIKPC